jgi:hypothetical protein
MAAEANFGGAQRYVIKTQKSQCVIGLKTL